MEELLNLRGFRFIQRQPFASSKALRVIVLYILFFFSFDGSTDIVPYHSDLISIFGSIILDSLIVNVIGYF